MRRHVRFSAAALALILLFTLSACRPGAPVANTSEAIPEASSAQPVSSETSSAAASSSEAVSTAASSSEVSSSEASSIASSQESSSSKAAVSSKAAASSKAATSSKAAASSKAASSSKATSSSSSSKGAYVGMKETLTTDSGYVSSNTSSGANAEPYFFKVYTVKADSLIKFYMQSGGSCRVSGATLTGVNSSKSGATADVFYSDTSVTVSPYAIGSYYITIKVEDPSNGTNYTFETTVEAS